MLDVRPADSDADRLDVMRLARLAFQASTPWEAYAAHRLASGFRRRATWWLGRDHGEPVASLVCHPLRLARGSERRAAFGLASVSVHPDHQRQGHGTDLCRQVGAHEQKAGLLFSGVPPKVYEGCGYRVLPAYKHQSRELAGLIASGSACALEPLDPVRAQDRLHAAWIAGQPGWRLERTPAGWAHSLQDNPEDLWFGVPRGYLRVVEGPHSLEVVEGFADDRSAALRAAAALAADLGKERVTGWFGPDDFVSAWFDDVGRGSRLPMALDLPGAQTLWLSSADYF